MDARRTLPVNTRVTIHQRDIIGRPVEEPGYWNFRPGVVLSRALDGSREVYMVKTLTCHEGGRAIEVGGFEPQDLVPGWSEDDEAEWMVAELSR